MNSAYPLTREEFHAQQRAKSKMDPERFDAVFRTYPCWCGGDRCPGWRTLTEREVDVLIATASHPGHWSSFRKVFFGPEEP